jgi:hypothetical protein
VVIKLIDPKDHKQYFDWDAVGDRIMARAMEMYASHTHKVKSQGKSSGKSGGKMVLF